MQVRGNFYDYVGYSMLQFEVTVQIGGLVPTHDYAFVYVPVNEVSGCFPKSVRLDQPTIFTTNVPSVPNSIDSLYQSGATGGGIRVEWDIPVDVGSSGAIYYQVYMSSRLKSPVWELVFNGTSFYFWKTKLESEAPYLFMVSCMNEVGYSDNSSRVILNTTYISVPGPTGTPKNISATGGMIRLSWNPPEDNGGNDVTHYVVNGNERDVEVASTEVSFGGLLANMDYTFTVYAGNTLGIGTDGSSATLRTSAVSPPSVPTSIRVVKVSGGSAALALSVPTDTGGVSVANLSFEIYANDVLIAPTAVRVLSEALPADDAKSRRLEASDQQLLHLQVGSLLPTTDYTFTMKIRNAAGASGLTESTSGATVQASPPDQPAPPTATIITGGSMTLVWYDPVDSGGVPLTSYTLVVTLVDSEVKRCEGIIHLCEIGDLQSLTEYNVVLTAFNAIGPSLPSKSATFTTLMPTRAQAPQEPRVVSVTTTSASLAWLPCDDFGGNYIEGYLVEVTAVTSLAKVASVSVPVTPESGTVDDLTPNTYYYVTVVRGFTLGQATSEPQGSFVQLTNMSSFVITGSERKRRRPRRAYQSSVLHNSKAARSTPAPDDRMWYVSCSDLIRCFSSSPSACCSIWWVDGSFLRLVAHPV